MLCLFFHRQNILVTLAKYNIFFAYLLLSTKTVCHAYFMLRIYSANDLQQQYAMIILSKDNMLCLCSRRHVWLHD